MTLIIRTWTEADLEKLKELASAKASLARASVVLKRSTVAVKNKARELGLAFPANARFSYIKLGM